jgi:hypothetical protein
MHFLGQIPLQPVATYVLCVICMTVLDGKDAAGEVRVVLESTAKLFKLNFCGAAPVQLYL